SAATGRGRVARMEFSPEAKRAFNLQAYGGASAIEGVRLVELARHADDGGAMTELARLTDGRAAGLGDFTVRQVNYSEMAHGVRNLGESPGRIIYFTDLHFSPEPATCDEGRLPWDFAGKDVWEMTRG